jgi:hypothetical protein
MATVVAGAALGLSGCSSSADGQALAQQACVHVHRSVEDYERSVVAGTPPATVAALQKDAASELGEALPLAARANSDDGSWNSLMTTISQGANIGEANLVPALKAQCVVANTNPNVNPQNVNPNT